jgi:hypothetical protein
MKNPPPPPPGNLDNADPAIVNEYFDLPVVKQKNAENTLELMELSHKKIREFQEHQKSIELAETRGKIKLAIQLFSQGILNFKILMSIIRKEFKIGSDKSEAEIEKKVQEKIPGFHIPAH